MEDSFTDLVGAVASAENFVLSVFLDDIHHGQRAEGRISGDPMTQICAAGILDFQNADSDIENVFLAEPSGDQTIASCNGISPIPRKCLLERGPILTLREKRLEAVKTRICGISLHNGACNRIARVIFGIQIRIVALHF